MKMLLINVWMMISVFNEVASGQEIDTLSLIKTDIIESVTDSLLNVTDSLSFGNDSIPTIPVEPASLPDSLLFPDGKPSLDSIPTLPDSLVRRRIVIGQSDALDTLSNRLFAYKVLKKHSYTRMMFEIDTTMNRFEINNPVMRNYHAGAYLGNVGLSYYPIGFEKRKRPSDYPFLDHLSDYLHDPESTTYYQTQMPYTHIDFSSAGPKRQNETIFKLVHTQNVNKQWNVGFYYDTFSSLGQYVNQNASSNGFSLFSAYRGSQYSMYSNFNWNNVRMRENGGLDDIPKYEANEQDASSNSVRSTAGKTIILNRSLYVLQSYSPPKISFGRKKVESDSIEASRFAFVHSLLYDWTKREYYDDKDYPLQGKTPYLWAVASTRDSLHFRKFFNHFEILFKEQLYSSYSTGFSVGLLTEMDRYNINILPKEDIVVIYPDITANPPWGGDMPPISGTEITVNYRETLKHFNTSLTGSFFNQTGQYLNWDINGQLYFTGYKAGNTHIDGNVHIHYYTANGRNSLTLGGDIDNVRPSYFLNKYVSNLIYWENDFDYSQEIRLRGEFTMPYRKLKVGAYISQLNNYVYIDTVAMPAQSSDLLMTGTAYLEKDIKLWKFGFRFRLYGQYSSNQEIIPLPAFAGYQSTYFEKCIVKKENREILNIQIGWDIVYFTKYYAYAYMPATGMFHLQNEQKTGNYPFFDFFLNMQIKRARIFIRSDGLNTVFRNTLGKGNYMAYRYPTNDFRMKIGVSWAFYD